MDQESTPAEGQEPPATESTGGQEPTLAEGKTFDAEYVKQLRAESARYRKEAQEAKARASEYEDRDKSELEKLSGKLTKAEQARVDAETRLVRYEVATEKKVPADAVGFLTGSTREELEASADKLLTLVRAEAPAPDFDGGPRDPAPEPKTPDQAHNELAAALFGASPNQ